MRIKYVNLIIKKINIKGINKNELSFFLDIFIH
jgi:hypothetical protein